MARSEERVNGGRTTEHSRNVESYETSRRRLPGTVASLGLASPLVCATVSRTYPVVHPSDVQAVVQVDDPVRDVDDER